MLNYKVSIAGRSLETAPTGFELNVQNSQLLNAVFQTVNELSHFIFS